MYVNVLTHTNFHSMGHAPSTGPTRERLKVQPARVPSIALALERSLIVFRAKDAALNCILGAPEGVLPLWLKMHAPVNVCKV